ncbi:MAG: PepSY domain-containing protein [Roseococcus sp.]
MLRLSAGLLSPILLGAILVQAYGTAKPAVMRSALDRGEIRPVSEMIVLAEARLPGQVIAGELEPLGLSRAHEINPLPPNASPFEVNLDARSGALLGAQGLVQERGR